MSGRIFLVAALLNGGLVGGIANSRASLVVDQSFTPDTYNANYSIFESRPSSPFFQELAQTFTVGIGGNLTAVDVHIGGSLSSGALLFDIRSASNGMPQEADAPVLVSRTIASDAVFAALGEDYGYFRIDLSGSPLPVAPGDILAFVLRTEPGQGYAWSGANDGGDGYIRGGAFARNDIRLTWGDPFDDLGFRTYVDVAAIPEPSSLAMAGVGVLILSAFAARRRATIRC